MILLNTAEATVKKSLEAFLARQVDNQFYAREKLIDFYEGDNKEYIKKLINRKDKEGIPYSYTNLTKHIIRKKSMVYHTPPVRTYKGSDKKNDNYKNLIKHKNMRLKTCENQARLMPFILVRPYLIRESNDEYFKYQIVRLFHVFEDPKNTEYPAAVMYPILSRKRNEYLWEYMDAENHFVISNLGKKIKNQADYGIPDDMKNQYKELPFALCRFDDVIEDIWGGGAFDLVDANEMIDLALTELNYEFRWQSFKQMYVTAGPGTNLKEIKVEGGYNKVLTGVGENVNFGLLDLQPRFIDNIEVIKFQMNTIAMLYDITMKWELTGGAESGFALIVKNIDLMNSWQDDIEFCRTWEDEIFNKEKLVYEIDTDNKFPTSDLHVDFAEVRFPVSPEEKRAKWDWEFEHGISTAVDYMKAESPDTPEDELKQRLIDNAALKKEIEPEKKPLTFEKRLESVNV